MRTYRIDAIPAKADSTIKSNDNHEATRTNL
jgi:hypothetical protein